jgi:hypothetical protein
LRGRVATVRELACVGVPRTLLVAELPSVDGPEAPAIALSAGVHGDEPAAPWALLSLVRDGLLDRSFAYRLWPCTNPTGYAAGTRVNADGVDVNRSFGGAGSTPESRAVFTAYRDRSFSLTIDLHEDPEGRGFYCYELSAKKTGAPDLGTACVRAVAEAGFPIESFGPGFDLGFPPGLELAVEMEPGRVVPDLDVEVAAFGKALPYSPALVRRKTTAHALTFESPRPLPWESRIAIHRIAVVTAVERVAALRDAAEGGP